MASCAGCLQTIEGQEYLKCYLCYKIYDLICANEPREGLTKENNKSNWKCHECRNNRPKGDNTNTPVRPQLDSKSSAPVHFNDEEEPNFVSFRKKPKTSSGSKVSADVLTAEIRLFREDLRAVRAEIQAFRNAMAEYSNAIKRVDERIDDLAVRMEVMERNSADKVVVDTSVLEHTITELKMDLNDRDQEMLCNDVDISGIPETNNESTIHVVLSVAAKLGVPLTEADIVSAERAGPFRSAMGGEQRSGARPLAVRLARRTHRDQLLAAARVRRRVTTEGIDHTAPPRPFYVNERLTRSNRLLFRLARAVSARNNWRYVWTRGGKIYVRQEHGAPRHRLRSEDDLLRVFGLSNVGAA